MLERRLEAESFEEPKGPENGNEIIIILILSLALLFGLILWARDLAGLT